MRSFFDSLSDRERLLVAGAAVILFVLLLFVGLVNPIFSYRDNAKQRYAKAERMVTLMANAVPTASQPSGSLRTVVTQRARRNNLVIARIADGEGSVDLVFSDVPYDDFFKWLLAVTEEDGLAVAEALVRPGTAPGTVNVRLSLAR